ncbi:hypothetical protein GQ473_04740 [archaeon]|nr:hypothetical protein [archaeon]
MIKENRQLSKYLDIISLFLPDYNTQLTGREMGRRLGINHQTALNKINFLVDKNIITFERKGANKEYMLNFNNYSTKILLVMAENSVAVNALFDTEINVIVPELIDSCEIMILFGSFSSGTQDENSDIDIICAGKCNKEMVGKIRRKNPREINVQYITRRGLEKSLKDRNALAMEILRNHKIFGDVSKVVDIFWTWYSGKR